MKGDFAADYYRMTGRPLKLSFGLVVDFLFRHNVRYMFWVRNRMKKSSYLNKYILFRYSRKYGLEMSPSAVIGKGLYLGHPYNITIGDGVRMGENNNIHKGATIGVENRGRRAGAPTLGNRVYIGINATVIGKITIGDDVMIAPNSFVNFDVPSHSVVVGNPGVIHTVDDATVGYIRDCV